MLLACAKEGFPPGGPEDKTPPVVVKTLPAHEAVRVDPNTRVEIHFSERVRAPSSRDAVFIAPFPGEDVRFKWRGRRLDIRFPSPLKANRTYVITIGTVVRDERNNPLEASYSLAFSTGDSLDRGKIGGRVYGEKNAAGIGVWAYALSDTAEINPRETEPDYVVQCSQDGSFQFTHVAPGDYRVFAVHDRLADRMYKPVEDRIGIGYRDVALRPPRFFDHLDFFMTREDTAAFGLNRVSADYNRQVTLHFNRPVGVMTDSFRVRLASERDSIEIRVLCVDPESPRNVQLALTQPLLESVEYTLHVTGVTDRRGRPVSDTLSTVRFPGMAEADTIRPGLTLAYPGHRQRHVPVDALFRLQFNEMMDASRIEGIQVADTLLQPVDAVFHFLNPREIVGRLNDPLRAEQEYRWSIDGAMMRDLAGNCLEDTLIRFFTMNPDTLTEILGEILDDQGEPFGPLLVTAEQQRMGGDTVTVVMDGPGPYRIPKLMPGDYVIYCICDADSNGAYTHGQAFPYRPSERFVFYPDTIKVRTRWPNEGNDFKLP